MSSFESFESRRFCLDGLDAQSRDIVTVREALVSCDPEALLAAVLHEKAGWRMPFETFGERQRRALFKRMSAVLAVMDATAPYEGEAPSLLIVPWERFELADSRGLFRRRVDAAAVDVADARKARETLRACGGRARSCTAVDAAQRAHAQLAEGDAWEWGCFGQRLDGFAFEPWARSLAHRVWLPRSLCDAERCCVLASVFWSMTYLGFDEASGCVKWGERLAERGVRPAVAPNASSLLDERDFRVDEAYAGKASRFAACLNFNSWVDFLGAVVALAHLDGVP